jgi:hypothetical protein
LNISSSVAGITDELSDYVGLKSGLAITSVDVVRLLERDLARSDESEWWYSPRRWLNRAPQQPVRVRAEDFESLVMRLLYAVGALPSPLNQMQLAVKFAAEHPEIVESIPPDPDEEDFPLPVGPFQRFYWFVSSSSHPRDLSPELAKLIEDFNRRSILDLMFRTEQVQWDGTIPLTELFDLGELGTNTSADAGTFALIDQRFIDYLHAQPGDLSRMHWRQFEYLVGEFFRRNGYNVNVTAPSGDGGVDVRAVREAGIAGPELILIQAKRFSNDRRVDVETVKALWSDVNETSATRGVIATTSALAPGARAYCEARLYRLTAAERPTVEEWLRTLASHPRDSPANSDPSDAPNRTRPRAATGYSGIIPMTSVSDSEAVKLKQKVLNAPILAPPVIASPDEQGKILEVDKIGFLGTDSIMASGATTYLETVDGMIYRLPPELDVWARDLVVAVLSAGGRSSGAFPMRVEFGILNDRIYAEMLED